MALSTMAMTTTILMAMANSSLDWEKNEDLVMHDTPANKFNIRTNKLLNLLAGVSRKIKLFFPSQAMKMATINDSNHKAVSFTHGIRHPRRCEGFSHLTFLVLLLRVEKSEVFAPDSQCS